jgi:hypothetical protein
MSNDTESTSIEPEDSSTMVAVFSSSNHDGEMEAMAIKGLLDANQIPALIVGPHVLPTLEFQVQVPADLLAQAKHIIREARQGGRQAATEAEAQTEI